MGKTRLVGELARRADNAGARVAVGAGVDVGGEAPLAVWQELARALVSVVPVPPEAAAWPAELGRLSPDLAGALGRRVAPPVVAAPELERLRLFDAVLRLVEFAASGSPVLLVAEDLHRADRASLALCAHIGRRLARLPVLFVLTRRDRPTRPEADALVADLAGRGLDVAEIALGPLRVRRWPRWRAASRCWPTRILARSSRPPKATRCSPWRALARWPRAHRAPVEPARSGPLGDGGAARPARDLAEAVAASGPALSPSEIAALPVTADSERAVLDTGWSAAPGRPRLPSRAARRGGPRRPAGPGGHPSPGGARRRGGGRAGRRAGRRGRPPPAAGRSRRSRVAALASGRPGTPARWARCPRPPRSGGGARRDPDDAWAAPGARRGPGVARQPDEFERAWATALARVPAPTRPSPGAGAG